MDIHEIAAYLEGTCKSCSTAIEYFDLEMEIDELEDALLDVSLERCPYCDWWMRSFELINDDMEVVGCEQCRNPA